MALSIILARCIITFGSKQLVIDHSICIGYQIGSARSWKCMSVETFYFIIHQKLKCSPPLILLPVLKMNSNLHSHYCFTNHKLIKLTKCGWISTHLLLIKHDTLMSQYCSQIVFYSALYVCHYINLASRPLCMIYISLKFLKNHEIRKVVTDLVRP